MLPVLAIKDLFLKYYLHNCVYVCYYYNSYEDSPHHIGAVFLYPKLYPLLVTSATKILSVICIVA